MDTNPLDSITLNMVDGTPVITVVKLAQDPFTGQYTLRSPPVEVGPDSEEYKTLMSEVAAAANGRAAQAEGHLVAMQKRAEDAEKALAGKNGELQDTVEKIELFRSEASKAQASESLLRSENATLRVENAALRAEYGLDEAGA